MVRYDGCITIPGMAKYCQVVWFVSVNKVRNSRIRLTNIICNDLTYRTSGRVRNYEACGRRTDRQTHLQLITGTETQFYNVKSVGLKVKG